MKKKQKKLELQKLTISKLNSNSSILIKGGQDSLITCVPKSKIITVCELTTVTTSTFNPDQQSVSVC